MVFQALCVPWLCAPSTAWFCSTLSLLRTRCAPILLSTCAGPGSNQPAVRCGLFQSGPIAGKLPGCICPLGSCSARNSCRDPAIDNDSSGSASLVLLACVLARACLPWVADRQQSVLLNPCSLCFSA